MHIIKLSYRYNRQVGSHFKQYWIHNDL